MLAQFHTSLALQFAAATVLGIANTIAGWLSHDYTHGRSKWHSFMRPFGYFCGGMSTTWWSDKHNTHHARTNEVKPCRNVVYLENFGKYTYQKWAVQVSLLYNSMFMFFFCESCDWNDAVCRCLCVRQDNSSLHLVDSWSCATYGDENLSELSMCLCLRLHSSSKDFAFTQSHELKMDAHVLQAFMISAKMKLVLSERIALGMLSLGKATSRVIHRMIHHRHVHVLS
jgi:hypothetical protein